MGKRLTDEERALRAITERQFQTDIITLARAAGWLVAHFHDSRRQVKPGVFVGDKDAKGFPDLVLVRASEFLILEVKRETGKVEVEQQQWLDALNRAGVEAMVVRPSDWPAVKDRLRTRRSHRNATDAVE